jgi:type II secretory pathway pseudopilin PulG
MKRFGTAEEINGASGFSLVELVIVMAMILMVTGFFVVEITQARQAMTRTTAARLFATQIEKARLDSVRRHPDSPLDMAQLSIINTKFYTLAIDADGDSRLDEPRVFELASNSDLAFNGPFPRTFMFNYRGRTVDAFGNIITADLVTISNKYGTSVIRVTNTGDAIVEK